MDTVASQDLHFVWDRVQQAMIGPRMLCLQLAESSKVIKEIFHVMLDTSAGGCENRRAKANEVLDPLTEYAQPSP